MPLVARLNNIQSNTGALATCAALFTLFTTTVNADLLLGPPAECQRDGETVVVDGSGNTSTFQEPQPCPPQTGEAARMQSSSFLLQLGDRISQQRRTGRSAESATAYHGNALGGAASADFNRLSVFAINEYSEAERDETEGGRAFDQDTYAAVLGFDYRLGESWFAGATASYLTGDTDLDRNAGSQEFDALSLGVHGSAYWKNNVFLDWMATYGELDLDLERADSANRYEASTKGHQWSADLSLGYQFNPNRWRVTPILRAFHLRGKIDEYEETVTASTPSVTPNPRAVEDQHFDSTVAELSLQADYVLRLNWGVLIPSLRLAYRHEFTDADKTTGQRSVDLGTNPFSQRTDDPDDSTAPVQLGISAQFQRGWSAFLSYEHLLAHDYLDRHSALLGARYELP